MVKVIVSLMLVCVVAIAVLTYALISQPANSTPASQPGDSIVVVPDPNNIARAEALAELSVPEFTLVDQNGTLQNHTLFDGQHSLLMLVFTNCPFACPQIMDAAMDVERSTAGSPLQFVAMSVDPTNDTPEALRAYAERYGADQERWTLLTGPEGAVASLAEAGLKMFITPDQNDVNRIELGDGSSMANILHPVRLILVGPDRRVLEIYSTTDLNERAALVARANALAG